MKSVGFREEGKSICVLTQQIVLELKNHIHKLQVMNCCWKQTNKKLNYLIHEKQIIIEFQIPSEVQHLELTEDESVLPISD